MTGSDEVVDDDLYVTTNEDVVRGTITVEVSHAQHTLKRLLSCCVNS